MLKKILYLKVGIALVFVAACQPMPAPTTRVLSLNLRNDNKLIIAINEDYPPFSAQVPNANRPADTSCTEREWSAAEVTGFDVAVALAIADHLGLEPCFIFAEWERMTTGYWGGDWDMAVASISITPQRQENLWFTQPYAAMGAQFFVGQQATWQNPSDLNGQRISVCSGCTYELFLQNKLELLGLNSTTTLSQAVVLAYNNENDAINALVNGDAEAVLTSPAFGRDAINTGLPLRPLGEPVFYEYIGVALDKRRANDAGALALAVHEAIRALHADGTLSQLSLTYLSEDVTKRAAQLDPSLLQLPTP